MIAMIDPGSIARQIAESAIPSREDREDLEDWVDRDSYFATHSRAILETATLLCMEEHPEGFNARTLHDYVQGKFHRTLNLRPPETWTAWEQRAALREMQDPRKHLEKTLRRLRKKQKHACWIQPLHMAAVHLQRIETYMQKLFASSGPTGPHRDFAVIMGGVIAGLRRIDPDTEIF